MAIEILNIQKTFGRQQILKGIDLSFKEGTIYSILGPNGSGKTTLMKSILGLVKADNGHISVMDRDISADDEYRRSISYVPQIARFPENLTVEELIELVQRVRQSPANPERYIALFNIEQYLKHQLKNLSGGTRQKVNLVLAFMFDTKILILDEPTSGLDPINVLRLKDEMRKMKQAGKCIILTTHILQLAEEVSDKLVFLLEGHIKYVGTLANLNDQTKMDTLEKSIAALLEINQEKQPKETPILNINKSHSHG